MKKFIPIVVAILFFASCEKEPNLDDVQNQVVTYTQYDKNANFSSAATFYVPDSLLLINDKPKATYLTSPLATGIIDSFVSQMELRGYTQVDSKDDAHFGVQISYIESTHYFVDYNDNNWWMGYPGYWAPGYWGPSWDNWYYPYVSVFSFTNNSLLTEIVNLTPKTANKLSVIWDSYITGLTTGSDAQTLINAKLGIEQSFIQSPYIKSSIK